MTPEERARADAISDAIAASVKQRRQQPIPGVSPAAPTASSRRIFYTTLLVIVLAAHVAGFLVYRRHAEAKAKRARIAAQEERLIQQAATAEAQANAERLSNALAATKPDKPMAAPTSVRKETPRLTRPVTPAPTRVSPTPAPAAEIPDVTASHQTAAENHAYSHFRYKYTIGSKNYGITSLQITTSETVQVPGWPRYRTQGEVGLEYYDGQSFKRTTRRFEVLTENKNGRIVATDITVKG
jgi:hypothetical protein